MTILDLAAKTGIDGHELRLLIKARISEQKKERLSTAGRRKLYREIDPSGNRTYGSARRDCLDCGAVPPYVNPRCDRCIKRERDRITYADRERIRKLRLHKPPCRANELDPNFSDNCGWSAQYEIDGILVCGVHESLYRKKLKRKCQAHKITDRFAVCTFNAAAVWIWSVTGRPVPVCHRHKAALSGSNGELPLNELWRNKKRRHKEQKKQVTSIDSGRDL
jgi:hypothetical protein